MLNHNTPRMIISLVILIGTHTAFSRDIALYCHTELKLYRSPDGKRRKVREFIVPDSGYYQRYLARELTDLVADCEVVSLKTIENQLKWGHPGGITVPLVLQIPSVMDSAGKRHIEALCVVYQDVIYEGALIDAAWDSDKDNAMDLKILSAFSQLAHLEIYGLNIDNLNFSQISNLTNLKYLGLPSKTADEHLKYISSLQKLQFVNLSATDIKGPGLRYLTALPKLKILDLRQAQLEPGALAVLKDCKSLETLLLSHSGASDQDMKALAQIKQLQYLTLHGTNITDDGLNHLAQSGKLKYVSLFDTATTLSARQILTEKLPDITIDTERPQAISFFIQSRQYISAYSGSLEDQNNLLHEYVRGKDRHDVLTRRGMYTEYISRFKEYDTWGGLPYDRIELLMWYYIVDARHQGKNWDPLNPAVKAVKQLQQELNPLQLKEARRRADTYLYVLSRSTFHFEPERKEGLPLYQYIID